MRVIGTILVILLFTSPSWSSCLQRPIGETLPSFRDALSQRLATQDLHLNYLGGFPPQGVIYEISPLKTGLRLLADEDLTLREIGIDIIKPFSDKNLDGAVTSTAFAVSRLSDEHEQKIKDDIYAGLQRHQNETTWSRSWGGTVVVISHTQKALVFQIYKADCETK